MAVRPVMVAADGSAGSLAAVEWAAIAAHRHAAPLLIVAAPSAPPRLYGIDVPEQTVADARRGMAARALDSAIRRAHVTVPGLGIRTALLSGLPPFAVAAAGEEAAMLVIGARGADGFAAMTLGSVSRYAAAHAACPVIVVRHGPDALPREVVVGIEDAEQSGDALAFGLEEARSRGAELTAVPRLDLVPRLRGPARRRRTRAGGGEPRRCPRPVAGQVSGRPVAVRGGARSSRLGPGQLYGRVGQQRGADAESRDQHGEYRALDAVNPAPERVTVRAVAAQEPAQPRGSWVPCSSHRDLTSVGAGKSVTIHDPSVLGVAAAGPLAGILRFSADPIVSRDIVGDPASCVFDSALTQASGTLVKVFGWYDNEWGYTSRLADLAALVGQSL